MMRFLATVFVVATLASPAMASSAGDSGQGGGAAATGAGFVRVPPVIISVLSNGELGGKMSVAFVLEPHDAQAEVDIKAMERQLHDAYLRAMLRLAEAEERTGKLTTIRQVKDELLKATDKVLGKGRVNAVLMQAFVRRGV